MTPIGSAALALAAAASGIAAAPPASAPVTRSSAQVPVEQMEALLDKIAAEGKLSGTVLVAKDGKVLLERSYGLANAETEEKNGPDTQFGLASLDKFITRLAIFQLLQDGKLQLSDPVGKLLPDLPNEDLKRKATVQHLLDMSAGVPSFWNNRYAASRKNLRTTGDYLDLFVREPLRFEPGTKREYSNGGFVVLGAIVERLSGMSYDDYVRMHITGPAGMERTGLFASSPPVRGRAIGYTRAPADMLTAAAPGRPRDTGAAGAMNVSGRQDNPLRPNTSMLPFKGSAAGGGYSTAGDLLKLDRAIRSDRLLKPRFTDLFLQGSFRKGEGRPIGWNGGTAGQNVQFIMYPDGVTLIVLANQDPPAANRVARQLAQLMGKSIDLI